MKCRVAVLLCLSLLGCSSDHDPTIPLAPTTPVGGGSYTGPPGVKLTYGRKGDFIQAIVNVWVQDSGGALVRTLQAFSGNSSLSFVPSTCPCLTPPSVEAGYWPQFWPASNGADPAQLDGIASATLNPGGTDVSVSLFWPWDGHGGAVVPTGRYTLHVEVSGYLSGT